MPISTLNDADSWNVIHDCLVNADWTEEEIENISDESLAEVVRVINARLIEKAQEREKDNQEKYAKCMQILYGVNSAIMTAAESIDDLEEWELEEFINRINALDIARYAEIEKIIGKEAMTYILTGEEPGVNNQ
jgi:hypothetical protein